MENKERLLWLIPLIFTFAAFIWLSTHIEYKFTIPVTTTAAQQRAGDLCVCPAKFDCTSKAYPVMKGLDFVQYFETFKTNSIQQPYDEQMVGTIGKPEINSTYEGYTYYFVSRANKDLFDVDPQRYLPDFGGFCAWGISSEYCPYHAWSETCLGPVGDPAHWTILRDKLMFFQTREAKANFLSKKSVDRLVLNGKVRWNSWFTDENEVHLTQCI